MTSGAVKADNSVSVTDQQQMIDDTSLNYFIIVVGICVHGTIALFGTASNIVNIIIFSSQGMKDSMTISLLTLSFSDFCVTFLQMASSSFYVAHTLFPDCPVDILAVRYWSVAWVRYIAYLISCWTTTVISIERCFCVVCPFTVRHTFTRVRCVVILIIIYICHIAIHVPVFMTQFMVWKNITKSYENFTTSEIHVTIEYTNNREEIVRIIDSIVSLVLSVLSQALIIICTVWMILALYSSTKVRQVSVGSSAPRSVPQLHNGASLFLHTQATKLSTKEQQLVKVVLFLAVLLTVCNVPNLIVLIVHHSLPYLQTSQFANIETFMFEIADLFNTMYSSFNIIVYLRLNSNYRRMFMKLFCSCYRCYSYLDLLLQLWVLVCPLALTFYSSYGC
ncbi:hypothetical protein Btru_065080 [Bulinus truncatus]|nr:hypothetical protein Btru_065080 [Bulinus truncatus]